MSDDPPAADENKETEHQEEEPADATDDIEKTPEQILNEYLKARREQGYKQVAQAAVFFLSAILIILTFLLIGTKLRKLHWDSAPAAYFPRTGLSALQRESGNPPTPHHNFEQENQR